MEMITRNKMIKWVLLTCILFLLFSLAVAASKREFSGWNVIGQDLPIGSDHGVPTTPWYKVSQWEVNVCSYYGGNDPTAFIQPGAAGEYYHNLMLTLQAQKSSPLPSIAAPLNTRIYEVAYFIQPTEDDESVNFEVIVRSRDGVEKSIASGSSNYVNGYRDYYVEESETNYSLARLHYWNQKGEGTLEVNFMEQPS
ncbi:hypothetical protein HY772_07435 [Candidatus Woesearchaeota archaeon]|nr:hypothetical protein [Candidatus Woesearchaeota archaeon]